METVILFHEIDDQAAWLASENREGVFGPLGITVRTFVEPTNPNRAAVLVETPDMETLNALMTSPEAAVAMAADGVRADTVVMCVESSSS